MLLKPSNLHQELLHMQQMENFRRIKRCWVALFIFLSSWCSLVTQGQTQSDDAIKLKTVIIDAGHGGKDSGALGRNHEEKDIVLAVALKVREYLNQYLPHVKVIMTRDKDVFVPLNERAQIANKSNADLFVSIHANSIRNPRIFGAETFVLGLHRSKENLEVAKKENSVIVLEDDYRTKYEGFDPNSTESYIIFELMQNVYLDQSIGFASAVQDQFEQRVGRHNRGVKQAGFLVLRETSMPGVLVELGFLSNRNEERFMASEQGEVYLASAIFRAIRDYKERYDALNSKLVSGERIQHDTIDGAKESDGEGRIEYRIQVASSPKPLTKDEGPYKEFDNVWEYKEGDYFKYTTGLSTNHQEILKKLPEVRKVVPDCFIVGFKNGERIMP